MITRFINAGGSLSVEAGDTGSSQGIANQASYNPSTQTIKINPNNLTASGTLNKLSKNNLANIGHEFWHAYKAQVIDKGFDPDMQSVFNNLKTWLQQQTVQLQTPGQSANLYKKKPFADAMESLGLTSPLSPRQGDAIDDFADEYVADIVTTALLNGPWTPGAWPATSIYHKLSNLESREYDGYQNTGSKLTYRVLAPPPPELMFQIIWLTVGSVTPAIPAPSSNAESPEEGSFNPYRPGPSTTDGAYADRSGSANSVNVALDNQLSGEIAMLEEVQSLDLEEQTDATDATTSRYNHTVDPIGVHTALSYHRAIAGSDFMVGASASLNVFNVNNRQYFASGSSWGTNVNGYGALTGQLLYSPPSLSSVGFFVEAGAAIAHQTISATFAPAFSSGALVPGFVAGGGVKIVLPALGAALGHPVLLTAQYEQVSLANQTTYPTGSLFHYTASSELRTVSAGLEIRF